MQWLFGKWDAWMKARGSWRDIRRYDHPYLQRWFLLSIRGHGLFLHAFFESDLDGLHDHPWPWKRLILRGSYWEEHHDGTRTLCEPGHYVSRSARELHRVQLIDGPVWTLFYHGPRERAWGFAHGRVWRTYATEDSEGSVWEMFWEEVLPSERPQHKKGWLFPRIVA